eukprot:6370204-Pyramimonas_sp.AAC.1
MGEDLYEVYALTKKHWRRRTERPPRKHRYSRRGTGKGNKGVIFQRSSGWSCLSEVGDGALCPN